MTTDNHTGDRDMQRVSDHWNVEQPTGTQWTETIQSYAYTNRQATGDPNMDWIDHSARFLTPVEKPRRALSLACGFGVVERIVRQRDICQFIDGIDVADAAIADARREAERANLDGLTYQVMDLEKAVLPANKYDVVYAHAALHHVFHLEDLIEQIRSTLTPGGLLIAYEYVGPSRMQFPTEYLTLADQIIRMIPQRYRQLRRWEGVKEAAPRLTLEDFMATDPSEAIRSAEIIPLLRGRFETLHYRGFGGTLLMMILNEIAGNFAVEDKESQQLLESIIGIEEILLNMGAIESYHAYLVCRNSTESVFGN